MIGIETRLHRQCHECTFHGVAVDLPLPALVPERGIITEQPATDDRAGRCYRGSIILCLLAGEAALGRIAGSSDQNTVVLAKDPAHQDRKSVVSGKSVSVRVDRGVRRLIKKKKKTHNIK